VWLLIASHRRSMNMIGAAPILWALLIIIGVLTTT
jgi:hypothetical protein